MLPLVPAHVGRDAGLVGRRGRLPPREEVDDVLVSLPEPVQGEPQDPPGGPLGVDVGLVHVAAGHHPLLVLGRELVVEFEQAAKQKCNI